MTGHSIYDQANTGPTREMEEHSTFPDSETYSNSLMHNNSTVMQLATIETTLNFKYRSKVLSVSNYHKCLLCLPILCMILYCLNAIPQFAWSVLNKFLNLEKWNVPPFLL